jgi:hypothetical protein
MFTDTTPETLESALGSPDPACPPDFVVVKSRGGHFFACRAYPSRRSSISQPAIGYATLIPRSYCERLAVFIATISKSDDADSNPFQSKCSVQRVLTDLQPIVDTLMQRNLVVQDRSHPGPQCSLSWRELIEIEEVSHTPAFSRASARSRPEGAAGASREVIRTDTNSLCDDQRTDDEQCCDHIEAVVQISC